MKSNKSECGVYSTRQFPSFPILGTNATVLSTRLQERHHTARLGSHLHYRDQTGRSVSRVVAIKSPH
jgi:hypothetical protein